MKLKYKVRAMQEPPGGQQFVEDGITFTADRFEELAEKVTAFRVENRKHPGDAEQDILKYYSEKWPHLVEADFSSMPEVASAKTKWSKKAEWVQKMWKVPQGHQLSQKEAEFRWAVCKDCPFNFDLRDPRNEYEDMVNKSAFLLRRGQDVPEFIHFCALHNFPIEVASFLDDPARFSGKDSDKNYDKCWAK